MKSYIDDYRCDAYCTFLSIDDYDAELHSCILISMNSFELECLHPVDNIVFMGSNRFISMGWVMSIAFDL